MKSVSEVRKPCSLAGVKEELVQKLDSELDGLYPGYVPGDSGAFVIRQYFDDLIKATEAEIIQEVWNNYMNGTERTFHDWLKSHLSPADADIKKGQGEK